MAGRAGASQRALLAAITIVLGVATLGGLAQGLCPARCRCDDEALRVSCASAGLDVVPIQLNPELRHLDLSANRVASLHLTFAFYGNLESLDLSGNLIHTLGSDNFALQQRLTSLNVSGNGIRTISKNALKGLAALRELDLSSNNVTEVEEQAFKYTSELEYLDLSRNSITSLPEGLLKNLHRIRSLILSRNSLLEVPGANLALPSTLERLDLSDNLIQELADDALPSLPALVSLSLANNVIRSVSVDSFDRLPGLLHLDLAGNNLKTVPTPALARLNVLQALVLSRNPLTSLDSIAFGNLFEMRHLELENCNLEKINSRAFADNVNLEVVILDGNRNLSELPARVLYGARHLRRVSLRRCNLATLQPTHFPVDNMAVLRIGGNPFVCNCSLHWLWNVIRSEQRRNESKLEIDSDDVLCADQEFFGKALVSLPESSLRCRLSPLYLSLFAAGCVTATAAILAFVVHVTRVKRRKRSTYTAPRPELLVYVGQGDRLDKSTESYSHRLIAGYETPGNLNYLRNKDANVYDVPQFTRPRSRNSDNRQEEGVYAVADVVTLQDEAPEVLSLYHMQTPAQIRPRTLDYEYEAPFHYHKQKPHIVFV
ncbi:chondroadherin [Cephus cinctus]|uniref:Chondroadherin n=1 Tax=Cephus cinctus TaxID=211228 RepID=A0AAJ7C3Q8_CEPCN|nr:chondroadherin [Cephus cinctus]XP_015601457.1 chondroadherin [Cephus cinctus]XP_015601546.1 chondroadherin [Cephus cinctus]XP_015601779.1 chondroadherin [Cephus cinctus]XP_015601861.1 chondroadherin [Cephus cinctus]XP_024945125.1 chondroadherin [Cephus cinctus]XP_024945167.1 chondroadherin [Cephus cinctus]XP_024945198.1 chondroadherin [Cephus cinctus]XP_024945281.1 chondroadherin [Cephus cinctus]XP_024945324.1 chondroadherin [Cephus cinctus]XP_024945359.1 chondroadherin [Cephus cinctus